ncbi:amidohydrolase family protein [candidate division KSB1 bacterium]
MFNNYLYRILLLTVTGVFLMITNCGKPYDTAIINGTIAGGDGNPVYKADIGIKGEKIVFIGKVPEEEAGEVIDASGLYVSPGFIDIHTHGDRGIDDIPTADNYLLQGVTTIVGGNCGGHVYPLEEHFKKLKKHGIAINFCSLIGHNTVRQEVMGLKMADPTPEEMEKMKELVDQEMRAGAVGFSTGLAYMPGIYSKKEEIIELAGVVSKYGGFYASHIRDQGTEIVAAIEEAIEIGEKNGLPVQVSHIKLCIEENWGKPEKISGPVEAARRRGVEVTTDQYPYTATSSGFASSFPAWSLEGGNDELVKRLKDPENYKKVKDALIERRLISIKGIDKLKTIYIANYEKERSFEGKNLNEILKMQGKEPNIDNGADLIIEIQKNGGASCVFFQMDEQDIAEIMNLEYNMIGSDGEILEYGKGFPHCRSYGTFPRVIGKYVREKKAVSLESAIKKMTSLPAQTIRISGRGLIKEGLYADIVIFDLKTIKDSATYQDPHQYPEGIRYVIVNGKVAAADGKPTGVLPGKIINGPGKK